MNIGIIITCFEDRIPFALKNIEIIREKNKNTEYKIILINNGICDIKRDLDIVNKVDVFIQNRENKGLQNGDWIATLEGLRVAEVLGCDIIARMGYRDYVLYDEWIEECVELMIKNNKKAILKNIENSAAVEGSLMFGYLEFINYIMPLPPIRHTWEESFGGMIENTGTINDILFELGKFYCFDHSNENIRNIEREVLNDSNYW
jgi:hypothetical protein